MKELRFIVWLMFNSSNYLCWSKKLEGSLSSGFTFRNCILGFLGFFFSQSFMWDWLLVFQFMSVTLWGEVKQITTYLFLISVKFMWMARQYTFYLNDLNCNSAVIKIPNFKYIAHVQHLCIKLSVELKMFIFFPLVNSTWRMSS